MDWLPVVLAAFSLGAIGLILGMLLTAADKRFAVALDERWALVKEELGGANCGACGYSGCAAYAEAVVAGKAPINACPSASVDAIASIMGVQAEHKAPMKAYVQCQAYMGNTRLRYDYDGYKSCATAASMAGGPKLCCYACVGLGDCVKVCPFGAISLKNGNAAIDEFRCVGCGNCVKYCPRGVLHLKPASAKIYIKCSNGKLGRTTRAQCIKTCIACGACVKKCPQGAISLRDGHAVIDYDKCDNCMVCVQACPSWCIVTEQDWR